MIFFLVTYFGCYGLLFLLEWMHRRNYLSHELTRKILHVAAGMVAISWPFFVSGIVIVVAELIFITLAFSARKLKLFKSQIRKDNSTYGDIYYSAAVIILILLGVERWVYVVSILHVALADAASALVGKWLGKGNQYKIFGHIKSLAGSSAFFVTSLFIMLGVLWLTPGNVSGWQVFIIIPLVTTLVEAAALHGSDNLLVAMAVMLLL